METAQLDIRTIKYRGYLVVVGHHAHTGVATFKVLRAERDSDALVGIYEGIAEGRYRSDETACFAAGEAGRAYVDSLPILKRRALAANHSN
jgi:hypothetical protein